jgi:hypothetical protein
MKPDNTATISTSRRALLKGLLISGAALAIAPRLTAQAVSETDRSFATFMQLSKVLTQRQTLPDDFAHRIYDALNYSPNFKHDIETINLNMLTHTGPQSDREYDLADQILEAWYRGIVHKGGQDTVVGFEQALMHETVHGALGVRSFCFSGEPGDWANPANLDN